MELEDYKKLILNPTIDKIDSWDVCMCLSKKGFLLAIFCFKHDVFPKDSFTIPDRRISLKLISMTDRIMVSRELTPKQEHLILVNSKSPDYAFTFSLTIDEANQYASAKIKDWPELGLDILTNEELQGIEALA